MSCPLPPEILDSIIDHLRDEPTTLKACCVVSKSWIHRTRTHLFARVEFYSPKSHVELWKKTFPDPPNSPAHHTRHLSVYGLSHVTAVDAEAGGWIRTFYNLVHLHLEGFRLGEHVSLVPFHGLSPTLRSLHLIYTSPEVSDLICSFPLLEDLALIHPSRGSDTRNTLPTSPKLTGTLNLNIFEGVRPVVRRLLDLPGGLHFIKITVGSIDADATPTADLVSRCSDTLESLSVDDYFPFLTPGEPPLDLSKAAKLKDLSFRYPVSNVQRITMALQSVKSENLRQITIHPHDISADQIGEAKRREWQDLDRLLIQFWTSHSVRPKFAYKAENGFRDLAPSLLPELMRRGLVDLVEHKCPAVTAVQE